MLLNSNFNLTSSSALYFQLLWTFVVVTRCKWDPACTHVALYRWIYQLMLIRLKKSFTDTSLDWFGLKTISMQLYWINKWGPMIYFRSATWLQVTPGTKCLSCPTFKMEQSPSAGRCSSSWGEEAACIGRFVFHNFYLFWLLHRTSCCTPDGGEVGRLSGRTPCFPVSPHGLLLKRPLLSAMPHPLLQFSHLIRRFRTCCAGVPLSQPLPWAPVSLTWNPSLWWRSMNLVGAGWATRRRSQRRWIAQRHLSWPQLPLHPSTHHPVTFYRIQPVDLRLFSQVLRNTVAG